MTIHPNLVSSQEAIQANIRSVNHSVRTVMRELKQENTLVAETPAGKFQKVLKIYRGVKPLFQVLGVLPLLPSSWRAAIVLFDQSLEALTAVSGEVTAQFKAGKDL